MWMIYGIIAFYFLAAFAAGILPQSDEEQALDLIILGALFWPIVLLLFLLCLPFLLGRHVKERLQKRQRTRAFRHLSKIPQPIGKEVNLPKYTDYV